MYQWTHLAATWDGQIVRLYVNGILDNTHNYSSTLYSSGEDLLIGKDPPGVTEYMGGNLDDIRIYNRALSESEIKNLYDYEAIIN